MPDLDIVVPVHNEEAVLARSIGRLHGLLAGDFPFSWRIVIADNASTDGTQAIASDLARRLAGVEYLRLEEKGRGRALRAAWTASDASVVSYMDVDLSTDLRALLPLVAPLLSGHSDVSIGTRLARGAQVVRGAKRELISRTYNHLLRATLFARFSDAQCGFKAVRADALPKLLPHVRDEGWFFDTELLITAQRSGLRIHEVPVDWEDDPDSRVDIVSTAVGDLKGIARLLMGTPAVRFMAVGVASTLAYVLLFLLLRAPLGPGWANAAALAMTGVGNTAANRLVSFRIRGRERLLRQHALGFIVFLLTLGITTGALGVLTALDPRPERWLELAVLVVSSLAATVTRFLALKVWVFAGDGPPVTGPPPAPSGAAPERHPA